MQCRAYTGADPSRHIRVDAPDGKPNSPPLHRLVSRRPAPVRSSCAACRLEERRAGDLSLRVRRASSARPLGGAARWWLAQSLRALQKSLAAIGSPLVLRRGSAAKIIAELAREADAGGVFWNEIAQAPHQAVADQVAARAEGGSASPRKPFPAICWWRPADIRNKDGRGLRVFTPFWKRVRSFGDPPKPLPAPKALSPVPDIASEPLESWHLEPTHPDWAGGLRETWTPGEASAQAQLRQFLNSGVAGYSTERDRPDRDRDFKTFAASALWRDQPAAGLARGAVCRRRASRSSPATSTNSSANWAGANSAGICCSTYPTSPNATCSPHSTPFPGKPTPGRCAPGSAARPAIPSSMPACASSGTPA